MFPKQLRFGFLFLGVCNLSYSSSHLMRAVPDPRTDGNHVFSEANYNINDNADFPLQYIQQARCRIRFLKYGESGVTSNYPYVRIISRVGRSSRALASQEWLVFGAMTMNILKSQSWFTTWWGGFDTTSTSCGVALCSAGPVVDVTSSDHTSIESALNKAVNFFEGLKVASISESEVTDEQGTRSTNNTTTSAYTVTGASNNLWKHVEEAPSIKKGNNYPSPIVGAPMDAFYLFYSHQFTKTFATEFLTDFKEAPVEILIINPSSITRRTILDKVKPLTDEIVPTTDTDRQFYQSGLSPYGLEIDIPCSGTSGESNMLPVVIIHLGPITAYTTIAADIITTGFSDIVDGQIDYATDWNIRGGCVFVGVRVLGTSSNTTLSGDTRKKALTDAIASVRTTMTLSKLQTDLAAGGDLLAARTTNPIKKTFLTASWFSNQNDKLTNAMEWLTEAFKGERALEFISAINSAITDGTMTVDTLASSVHTIINTALDPSADKKYCLYNFEGV